MKKLIIYTDFVTERLLYTLNFICGPRGIEFSFCNDPKRFSVESSGAKLVYSDYPFEEVYPTIIPSQIIFEDEILDRNLAVGIHENQECIKFDEIEDPIASIFYVITRYEEYLSFPTDEHDRFNAAYSILKKFNWLHLPIADVWATHLLNFVSKTYLDFQFTKPSSSLCLSFDIDNTFAFKYKNWMQLLGGKAKDFVQGNSDNQDLRREVLSGQTPDPNDTFDLIIEYSKRAKTKIFWHLGDFKKYDRNIYWANPVHQRLIQKMAQHAEIGIHPSYFSYLNEGTIKQERGRLEHILKRPVFLSRQHYLKVRFPGTFDVLHKIGVKHDYSIGFADAVGFRIGTAHTLPFYNLITDEVTDLQLHPFIFMDGTFNQYLKISPDEAKIQIQQLVNSVKEYGGTFICIWHNDTINNTGMWSGWREVLEETIKTFENV